LTEQDRATVARGRWAQRVGFGKRPAVIVIDAQVYMVGERGRDDSAYPLSCGEVGWKAIDAAKPILSAARAAGAPVIYTRFALAPGGLDSGVFANKLGSGQGEFSYVRGTKGVELIPEVAAQAGELVIDKVKQSAFFGTPLLPLLVHKKIDTVIVVGGSTSNCIRATVVDAAQHNFHVIVPEEAVFDRIGMSHAAALFDMDRTYADVVAVREVVSYLSKLPPQA